MKTDANTLKDLGLSFPNGTLSAPFSFESPVEIGHGTGVFSDVQIGAHSYINGGTIRERTRIGRFCSIANGVVIGAPNHSMDLLSTHPFATKCPSDNAYGYPHRTLKTGTRHTTIENDVWIGVNAIIVEGVSIKNGAVVGAGAVVTKDVPPYSVVVGVPAIVVKYRFPSEIIAKLLQAQWWMFPIDFLRNLPSNNLEECIAQCEQNQHMMQVANYYSI